MKYKFGFLVAFLIAALFLTRALATEPSPTPVNSGVINYTVQNVDPSQIVATLQKLYGNQIVIATQNQQLLIRTSNANQTTEIQNLLPQLDKAARQLLITVRQNVPANQLQSYLNAAAGDVSGQPTQSSISTDDRASGDLAETQATEGQPAQVVFNKSVPLLNGTGNNPGWGTGGSGNNNNRGNNNNNKSGSGQNGFANGGGYVDYTNVNMPTGFNIITRVINHDALVDITSFNGAATPNTFNSVESSGQHTTLKVPLGQWALVSGNGIIDTPGSTSYQTGRNASQGSTSSNNATIIRVNLVGTQ